MDKSLWPILRARAPLPPSPPPHTLPFSPLPLPLPPPTHPPATDPLPHLPSRAAIASPDNISIMDGQNTLIIGEDTSNHQNDMVWAYNLDSGALLVHTLCAP